MSTSHLCKGKVKVKGVARNAERRFKTLQNNKPKWEAEQDKMRKLQEEFIKNLRKIKDYYGKVTIRTTITKRNNRLS